MSAPPKAFKRRTTYYNIDITNNHISYLMKTKRTCNFSIFSILDGKTRGTYKIFIIPPFF